jgi:peptidoglycan hydrolase-like protein with peptidoglycan-binding domain
MRFAEFKLLEETNNVVVIGDSIAVGINGGESPYAKGGISTVEVLRRVNAFIQTGKAKGATVILSSGASNSAPIELEGGIKKPGNGGLSPVAEQLRALKAAGATVALVGTGSKKSIAFPGTSWTGGKKYMVDLTGVNEQLASMASATGATFLGPLEEYDQGLHSGKGDGIHPYSGYSKLKQAGTAVAPRKGAGPMPAAAPVPNMKPGEDKMAHAGATMVLTVPNGNINPEIADIQKTLLELGYKLPKHGVDGVRGAETVRAIKQFQRDNGLEVDGDPGPETVGALNKLIEKNKIKIVKSTSADVKARSNNREKADLNLAYNSVTQGKIGKLLDLVAKPESGGHYDIMMGGTRNPKILSMTINELLDYQKKYKAMGNETAAAGRYQFMPKTLFNVANQLGLDRDKVVFDPATQDKCATVLLKEKGLDQWLAGKMSDKQFMDGLSQVWAGLPSPSKGGASWYDKVGSNKAGMSIAAVQQSFDEIKST